MNSWFCAIQQWRDVLARLILVCNLDDIIHQMIWIADLILDINMWMLPTFLPCTISHFPCYPEGFHQIACPTSFPFPYSLYIKTERLDHSPCLIPYQDVSHMLLRKPHDTHVRELTHELIPEHAWCARTSIACVWSLSCWGCSSSMVSRGSRFVNTDPESRLVAEAMRCAFGITLDLLWLEQGPTIGNMANWHRKLLTSLWIKFQGICIHPSART